MENLYETLLGRPQPGQAPAQRQPFAWDAADGAGPDRLFNRYRRLRLDARSDNGADNGSGNRPGNCAANGAGNVTRRCPATPSAVPA